MVKCTIAIPVYNRQELVRPAVDSALAQDVPGLEILVVDNCSTDRTWEVLHTYHDPRLRLVRNEQNVGLFGNFNRCLDLAQGHYLRFLCSDDRLIPGCLSREIEIMDAHPNVALLTTRGQRVDESGRVLGPQADHFRPGVYPGLQAVYSWLWFHAHYAYNLLNYPSGILLRGEVIQLVGQFDTTLRTGGDIDFFLRMLEHGDLAASDTIGCKTTIHRDQESVGVADEGDFVRESYMLAKRYEPLLKRQGGYVRIMRQIAAISLGLAFKYWRMGMPQASRVHREFARTIGAGWGSTVAALTRLVGLRLLLKTTGIRMMPMQPVQPLQREPISDGLSVRV